MFPDGFKDVMKYGALGLLAFLALIFINVLPAWCYWVWMGFASVLIIPMIVVAFRQGCTAYGWYRIVMLLLMAGGVWLAAGGAYRLLGAYAGGADSQAGACVASEHSVWSEVGFWIIVVGFGLKIVADLVFMWFILQKKRYPERSERMRRLFWPVRVVFDVVIIGGLLLSLLV